MANERSQVRQQDPQGPTGAEKKPARAKTPASVYYPPHLSVTSPGPPDGPPLTRDDILFLQRTVGNHAVARYLQKKVKVSEPGDPYEKEADRVAEQVERMPAPAVAREPAPSPPSSEIKIARLSWSQGGELRRSGGDQDEKRKRAEEDVIQSKEDTGAAPAHEPEVESQINRVRGGGEPLAESVRDFYEPRFGQDFGGVRVHTGPQAAESARGVNARAYTAGSDIVFNEGEYAPETTSGRRLLAHELTHVVQQGAGAASAPSLSPSLIQRADGGGEDNLKKLNELLDKSDVPEGEVVTLLGKLSGPEKVTVLAGGYKEKIASALNVAQMVKAVNHLGPTLDVKLEWVRAASIITAQIVYSDIQAMIGAASQTERDALKTDTWRAFFLSVCTNDTIIEAVNDLGFDSATKVQWILAEGVLDRPVTDANARQILDFLNALTGAALTDAILKLEAEGYLERLLEEISDTDRVAYATVIESIQRSRGMTETIARINSLLSYGVLDWAITDAEAHEVLVNLQNLTEERRRVAVYRMEESGSFQRLVDNVSGADQTTFSALIGDLKRFRGEYRDLMQGTKVAEPGVKTDVEKILTPGIVRDPVTGAPAPFVDVVAGKTYRQDIEAKLDDVRAWMFPQSRDLLAGTRMPMSRFEGVGAEAKRQTDALFGQYASGPPFVAGTRASGANLIDRSMQPPDPADLVRYLIKNQAEVLPVHTLHSAIVKDPPYEPGHDTENLIVAQIIIDYSAAHRAELEVIDRAWPAVAGGGVVEIQPFEGSTPAETRQVLWKSFQTMIHEYLHTITHPNYAQVANDIGGTQESILIEGGTSLFTDDVWRTIFPDEIRANAGLRANVEGSTMEFDASVIPPISHYDQIAQARDIRARVGDENMRAAYFGGHTELLGLGPTWTPTGAAQSQTFTVPATGVATVADVATATGVSAAVIAAANGIAAADAVTLGQQLTVPGIRVHIVLPGGTDTKAMIARRNGVTEADLERANPGVNWASLTEGQRIIIPAH